VTSLRSGAECAAAATTGAAGGLPTAMDNDAKAEGGPFIVEV
jgi:hypothetical protein